MGLDARLDKSDDEREKLFRDAKEKYEEAKEIYYVIYGREHNIRIWLPLNNTAVLRSMRRYEEARNTRRMSRDAMSTLRKKHSES